MSQKKRQSISIDTKLKIISESSNLSYTELAAKYNLSKNSIGSIIRSKDKLTTNVESGQFGVDCKKMRSADNVDIETCLLTWIKQARAKGIPVSGPILQEKAIDFAKQFGKTDFKCSSGWVDRFKLRHNLVFKKICGESKSVADCDTDDWYHNTLPTLLSQYNEQEIYNADETGLFWRLLPDKTLTFKDDDCSGGKRSKERLTVLVGANLNGSDKLPLLAIGKFEKPRCFKNVKKLPLDYNFNRKAWMTSSIFEKWLTNWNKILKKNKRKVALIINNCPSHPVVELSDIKLVFLPPNTTSKTQPMDQGVINCLKINYRQLLVKAMIRAMDKKEIFMPTLLDAMTFLSRAWDNVSGTTISRCFSKAGFRSAQSSSDEENTENPFISFLNKHRHQIQISEDFDIRNYLNADENLVVAGYMEDSEIAGLVKPTEVAEVNIFDSDDSDADDLGEENAMCSYQEAKSGIVKLRKYIMTLDDCDEKVFSMLNKIEDMCDSKHEKSMKQTSITDYLQ